MMDFLKLEINYFVLILHKDFFKIEKFCEL